MSRRPLARTLGLASLGLGIALGSASGALADESAAGVCDPAQASKRLSARVLSTARVSPYLVDGRFIGIHVSEIQEHSPLFASGIRNGDLVIEAAGAQLNDVEKATTFFCLIGVGRGFAFKVRRSNGEIEALAFPAAQ